MTFEQNTLPCSYFTEKKPLLLENGTSIDELTVAYESYGKLNKNKSNAIIVCHALSGDQFLASKNPITNKDGWWDRMVGPGKPIDTDRYFVICANVLGGCIGSTGPTSIDPKTNEAYGLSFPVITISDMVNAQIRLINHLGIEKLLSVIGGSMGGMQVLEWAASYPDRLHSAIPIATSSRHTAQNIAFHELGRQAIMADPDWNNGNYIKLGTSPTKGLSIARMTAHVTYLSEASLTKKFGRRLQDKKEISFGFDADFQIESYLRYQGSVFVDRFDANSYLYITRAMDYFDLAKQFNGNLSDAFKDTKAKFFVISFTSDWLYPTQENKDIVIALNAIGADVGFVEIESDKGHDSFLLDVPEFLNALKNFLDKSYTTV